MAVGVLTMGSCLAAESDRQIYEKAKKETKASKELYENLSAVYPKLITGSSSRVDRFTFSCRALMAQREKDGASEEKWKSFCSKARKLWKTGDELASPIAGYVYARLGIVSKTTSTRDKAASMLIYQSERNGTTAQLVARVLMSQNSINERARSLPFALEAQRSLPDSGSVRLLVAGAYFFAADANKDRAAWQKAIDWYEKGIPLLKGTDLELAKNYLIISKRELKALK